MQAASVINIETLKPEVRNYIRELENKYLELKERYDAMMYKKYVRSAEELSDDKQQSLFIEETEQPSAEKENEETEKQEIKSYTRKKP